MAALTKSNEIHDVFNRFDTNGDGLISATELTDVLKSLGTDSSPDEINRMMEELDADRDGFINVTEFASFFKSLNDADDDESGLRDAFNLYDKNGNGLISAVELHQVLHKLGEKCTVEDCSKMIQSVDSDGDGNVNFEEFKKMMSNSKTNSAVN